jgi:hypothetical protein
VDYDTQRIIYALDAINSSVKIQTKLLGEMKALMAPDPPVYVCDLEPSDLKPRPGKVYTFEPPAIENDPVCLWCDRACHKGSTLKQCPDLEECEGVSCRDCGYKSSCKLR